MSEIAKQHASRLIVMYMGLLGNKPDEARQCAIATINEVIGELEDQGIRDGGYYDEVKEHIHKLSV